MIMGIEAKEAELFQAHMLRVVGQVSACWAQASHRADMLQNARPPKASSSQTPLELVDARVDVKTPKGSNKRAQELCKCPAHV